MPAKIYKFPETGGYSLETNEAVFAEYIVPSRQVYKNKNGEKIVTFYYAIPPSEKLISGGNYYVTASLNMVYTNNGNAKFEFNSYYLNPSTFILM